jgi:hypothetical protein
MLPDVHYGTADSPPLDWRAMDVDTGEDDDEEDPGRFAEVCAELGIDPASFDTPAGD